MVSYEWSVIENSIIDIQNDMRKIRYIVEDINKPEDKTRSLILLNLQKIISEAEMVRHQIR